MIKIHFIEHDGNRLTIEAPVGLSLMESAINGGVSGIDADCGGACSCGTCHVHIGKDWQHLLTPRSDDEEELLDLSEDRRDSSRLSCQIKLTPELDGLVVEVPEVQA